MGFSRVLLLHMHTAQQIRRFLWGFVVADVVLRESLAIYIAQTSLQLTILSTKINAYSTMPGVRLAIL